MVRFKNRYVLGKIEWNDAEHMDLSEGKGGKQSVGSSDIYKAIRELVLETFGQFGFATIQNSIQVKYWNECTSTCILRVARDHSTALTSSLVYLTEIKKKPCTWKTLHLSGTIRNCQKVLYTYDKEILMLREDEDEEQDESVSFMDLGD